MNWFHQPNVKHHFRLFTTHYRLLLFIKTFNHNTFSLLQVSPLLSPTQVIKSLFITNQSSSTILTSCSVKLRISTYYRTSIYVKATPLKSVLRVWHCPSSTSSTDIEFSNCISSSATQLGWTIDHWNGWNPHIQEQLNELSFANATQTVARLVTSLLVCCLEKLK